MFILDTELFILDTVLFISRYSTVYSRYRAVQFSSRYLLNYLLAKVPSIGSRASLVQYCLFLDTVLYSLVLNALESVEFFTGYSTVCFISNNTLCGTDKWVKRWGG